MDSMIVIKAVNKHSISPSRHRVKLYFPALFEDKDGHVTSGWNFEVSYLIYQFLFSYSDDNKNICQHEAEVLCQYGWDI